MECKETKEILSQIRAEYESIVSASELIDEDFKNHVLKRIEALKWAEYYLNSLLVVNVTEKEWNGFTETAEE